MIKVIAIGYSCAAVLSASVTLYFGLSFWSLLLVFWLSGAFFTLCAAQLVMMRRNAAHRRGKKAGSLPSSNSVSTL